MSGTREEMNKIGAATRFRSGEEAAINGAKGGVASGESRRRKRDFNEAVSAALSMNAFGEKTTKALKALGYEDDQLTNLSAVVVAVISKAQKGDIRAAEFLRDTLGQNPQIIQREKELEQRQAEFAYQQEKDRLAREAFMSNEDGDPATAIIKGWELYKQEQEASNNADAGGT